MYDGERVLPDKMEGIETQLDEINQQRAELENMKKILEQQQLEIQKAREELPTSQQQQQSSQQQFEALRWQLEVQSSDLLWLRNVQLSASNGTGQLTQTPIVNNVRENYITDFSDILGNLQNYSVGLKTPEFKDENTSNPLEFISEVERFCVVNFLKN